MRPGFLFLSRLIGIAALASALGAVETPRASETPPAGDDLSRRLFDFAPVSADNPIVATIDGRITIPLSELRGYRDAEQLRTITDPTRLAQKRAVLDALINEYLYVDEAYRAGVPASAAFVRRMEATRTMLLTDFMAARAQQEAAAIAPSPVPAAETPAAPGADSAATALAEKLFAAASIEVSNEAYTALKQTAAAIDRIGAPTGEHNTRALGALLERTPEATLVRYENHSLALRQILAIYAGLPPEKRPAVQTEEGFIAMIKPMILPELMALEAAKRGIATEPAFQQKLIQNQNALLRFHVHGAIESRANESLRAPDLESRLAAWYQAHAARYHAPSPGADDASPRAIAARPFSAVRGEVLGDYSVAVRDQLLADKARELRQGRTITIDDAVLRQL